MGLFDTSTNFIAVASYSLLLVIRLSFYQTTYKFIVFILL